MKFSVIIPAYNEESTLPTTLYSVHSWLVQNLQSGFEIFVVDDGSTDHTASQVEALYPRMVELKLLKMAFNSGKGAAVREGMMAASGEIRLFMDADNSTKIEETALILRAIETGADLVIASRQHPDSRILSRQSLLRQNMGKFFNLLARIIVGISFRDTQCGFKAFTAKAAEALFPHQKLAGFSFDIELLLMARQAKLKVTEIPIAWSNVTTSRVHIFRDSWRMFRDLIWLRETYGAGKGKN